MNKTVEPSNQGRLMTITSTNRLKGNMRRTEIHLSEPFEEVLASLLMLPSMHAETDRLYFPNKCDAEVKEAFRSLYEAANGRQVETQVGFIAIAPPVAGFLKDEPYCVATQYEFFLEAFARILAGGSPPVENRTNGAWPRDRKLVTSRGNGTNVPDSRPKRRKGSVLLRSTPPRIARNQH